MVGRFLFGVFSGTALVTCGLVLAAALFPTPPADVPAETASKTVTETGVKTGEAVDAAASEPALPEPVAEVAAEAPLPATISADPEAAPPAETVTVDSAEASITDPTAMPEPAADPAPPPAPTAEPSVDATLSGVPDSAQPTPDLASRDLPPPELPDEIPALAKTAVPDAPAADAPVPEVAADTAPPLEALTEVLPEITLPEATLPEVIPEVTAEVTADVTPDATPEVLPQETVVQVAPAVPQEAPEALPETAAISESPIQPLPDPPAEALPLPTPDVTAETEALPEPELAALPEVKRSDDGVIIGRLPSIGDAPVEDTPSDASAEAVTDAAATARMGTPLDYFSAQFENPEDKPVFAIVLIDRGTADLDRVGLAALPFPVSFALDPLDPASAERAAIYRAGGKEVVMLATGIAEGAQASDLEVAFQSMAQGLPEAVAIMDLDGTLFQNNRPLATMVVPVVQAQGRGLLTWDRGLNAADQVARREDVPAAVIFRDLAASGEDEAAIQRILGRAIFKAGQDGRVAVAADITPGLVSTLLEWTVEGKAASVALAPVSAVVAVE